MQSAIALRLASFADAVASLPEVALWVLSFAAIALAHATLLCLPYYWDEAGYYAPAAWDFYRSGTLIPHFTNAHPPLPNVLIGSVWHVTGPHPLASRLLACAFAALAITAIFRLGQRLVRARVGLVIALLTAVYPIWFAQSSMIHADMFAAAFSLCALAVYLPAREASDPRWPRGLSLTIVLFSLAVLSKETAIVLPATLCVAELVRFMRSRSLPASRRAGLLWAGALAAPALPLAAWYAYHHARTGFTFGNPEYLRYNAIENFTAAHVLRALWYRLLHLAWQRNMWLPIVLTIACLLLPERPSGDAGRLSPRSRNTLFLLIAAQWIAFSILGGALLTRYLLPAYPMILLLCVSIWQTRVRWWPWLGAATAAVFIAGWWLSPPFAFAPEDNLTYRDMVVVQQDAIRYVTEHDPDATVLSAWPVSTLIQRPELGYVQQPLKVVGVQDFSLEQMQRAAQDPGRFDTAIVFTMHYAPPALARYWATHPQSRRGREFADSRDLTPQQIAALLDGKIVFHEDRNGEWADVIRFPRSYEAKLDDRSNPFALHRRIGKLRDNALRSPANTADQPHRDLLR